MKQIRTTLSTFFATLILLLAACGQGPQPEGIGPSLLLPGAAPQPQQGAQATNSGVVIEQLSQDFRACRGEGFIGQSFTATATGKLTSVALAPVSNSPLSNITLEIVGSNLTTVLHTQTIPTYTDAGGSLVTYTLTTPVPVVSGQRYGFSVLVSCANGGAYLMRANVYPGGSVFVKGLGVNLGEDLAFRVVIDPEPDTSITAKPPAFSNSTSASFEFSGSTHPSGSELAGFECKLDGGGFASCTSPKTYSALSEGSHTFQVRSVDANSNKDSSPASFTWTVDATAPTANPSQAPAANAGGWNNTDVTVTWNWADSGSGIDPANCTTTSTSSGEGTINLSATCKDKAGNQGSASYTVKVDKTAPTCTATVNPASLWAPNHKLTNITTSISISDTNADGFVLISVTSSEADSGLATDDVPNDVQGWVLNTADTSGQLRSERYSKNGRTYTLTYQAKDKAGNTAECKASVTVPKSQK